MTKRVGLYAWGGPGTIRLLQTKYHSPTIDTQSYLSMYELEYLQRAKSIFGVTDAWVTYSWGFSDATEQEDYQFLREKLQNFREVGIKIHAYVQGLNVVTEEFRNDDFFCLDPWGRRVAYSKGRSFICPNNPNAIELLSNRVTKASQEDVDGVYVDNILFGIPPFAVFSDYLPFFGCSCLHCQEQFKTQYGYPLPCKEKKGQEISDYLHFRATTISQLIERLARIVHREQKMFGINLYDPTLRLDTLYYGYSLETIVPFLDYLLIENHSLPSIHLSKNDHLLPLLQNDSLPVFVVSYKKGIGFESAFTQDDIDAIFAESDLLGYSPCLKGTEFTTNGIWHALDLGSFRHPQKVSLTPSRQKPPPSAHRSNRLQRTTVRHLQKQVLHLFTTVHENKYLASLAKRSGIYSRQVRTSRPISL